MIQRRALAGLLALPAIARAQGGYPDRPIRFLVPFPPGGGLIGTEVAAKAPADGYTLLFTITTHVQTPVVMRRFPYDPVADFAPIGRLGTTSISFFIGPKVPAEIRTMREFIAWGKG